MKDLDKDVKTRDMIFTDFTRVCVLPFQLYSHFLNISEAYFQDQEYVKGWRTKRANLLSLSIRECLDSVKVSHFL